MSRGARWRVLNATIEVPDCEPAINALPRARTRTPGDEVPREIRRLPDGDAATTIESGRVAIKGRKEEAGWSDR